MTVYLAGPNTQQQAEHLSGMPALLSFAYFSDWMRQYQATFRRILIDSGAFSEFHSGKAVDLGAYREWSQPWVGHADAVAGLDDIRGDWRKGLRNLAAIPWSFPAWHDSDPLEILPAWIALARERGAWLGIGLVPPRHGKEGVLREALRRIPEDIHVHGWALRSYTHLRRLDSVDSTNWWRDAMKLRGQLPWLTYGEALGLVVKRYERWKRVLAPEKDGPTLFDPPFAPLEAPSASDLPHPFTAPNPSTSSYRLPWRRHGSGRPIIASCRHSLLRHSAPGRLPNQPLAASL